MMFFSRRKKIVIDVFTRDQMFLDLFRLDKASNFVPDWWKKLPKTMQNKTGAFHPQPTLKTCAGFLDYFSRGYMVPLWSDFAFRLSEIGGQLYNVEVADDRPFPQWICHHFEQFEGFIDPNLFSHIKFSPPWLMFLPKRKKDFPFMFSEPLWNNRFPNKIQTLPGVVNFRNFHQMNVNCILKHEEQPSEFILEAGTPIVHLMPLFEEEIEMKYHLLSTQEYFEKAGASRRFSFLNYFSQLNRLYKNKE